MRHLLRLPVLLALVLLTLCQPTISQAQAPTCTGLACQQLVCGPGQTTSISGTVYAPNGVDPLPNVQVFIPNAKVEAFKPGVSCPVPGAPPSGSPLVGTTTIYDGSFRITNVPVGTNIPIVIQAGRWRRQLTIATTTACTDTAFSARMPRNQTEGDIPLIAVATGSQDSVECVLRKVGIDDTEFTNPLSTGRIHLYAGTNSRGAIVDANTPSQTQLMGDSATLNKYDVLMLPCQGSQFIQATAPLQNFINYANAGGRVYASHYSYVWMYNNPPLNTVANWAPNQAEAPSGTATINTGFASGKTLSDWMQFIGATTTPGQIALNVTKKDQTGVVAPTQSWLTLNNDNATMQLTFNTPVGGTNQCGRILFDEYHVENPTIANSGKAFPSECTAGAMTNQEKLLEYSLFDLTNNGGQPTLTPTSADFGDQAVGFQSAAKTFTWTNNSVFAASIDSAKATGDFVVLGNNCLNVAQGASCSIQVAYKPTALGAATGTLSVVAPGASLSSTLTGNGVPPLKLSTSALAFSNVDVGATATQSLVLQNTAPGSVASAYTVAGDYTSTSNCPATLTAGASCIIQIVFKPTATGNRAGTVTAGTQSVSLTGNGVDFTATFNPTSGTTIAGIDVQVPLAVLPVAGFSRPVAVSCTTTAPESTCSVSASGYIPATGTGGIVTISTTAKYNVIGFGGLGRGVLAILGALSVGVLISIRKRLPNAVQTLVALLLLAALATGITGCSGKQPTANATYTAPGPYTYTVVATDGFLTHSATYTLNVTAK